MLPVLVPVMRLGFVLLGSVARLNKEVVVDCSEDVKPTLTQSKPLHSLEVDARIGKLDPNLVDERLLEGKKLILAQARPVHWFEGGGEEVLTIGKFVDIVVGILVIVLPPEMDDTEDDTGKLKHSRPVQP